MPVDLSRVKGFCFDVDGTLSDTDDAWVHRLTRFLMPVKFLFKDGNPTTYARWVVMITESPMNAVYYWMDAMSLDDNLARVFEYIARRKKQTHKFWLMKGARELLNRLALRYPLTVVSARDDRSTGRFLAQFGLRGFFREVVTSQTCAHTKPFPDPILFAAKAMGVEPQNCLMIGDTTVDILAGKRAGAQTVGLLCGFGTEKELRRAGADLILNNLEELDAFLSPVSH